MKAHPIIDYPQRWFPTLASAVPLVLGRTLLLRYYAEATTSLIGILLWLAGSFITYDVMTKVTGLPCISFVSTLPFRLLFGIPAWTAVLLWYQLQMTADSPRRERNLPRPRQRNLPPAPPKSTSTASP